MQSFGKWLGRLLVVVLALALFLWLGPRDSMIRPASFAAVTAEVPGPEALDGWLAEREAAVPGLRDGAAKRIVWAGAPGAVTDVAVVYLHGFSASAEEVRPLPDEVAAALGANLFFTRLTGHGRDGAAMAEARPEDWLKDTAEALAIGRTIGRKVLVIGTSTGGTLAAWAATDPELAEGVRGVVLISPNFGVRNPMAKILDLPYAAVWAPPLVGRERAFTPQNERHAAHWTTRYPSSALFPMATLLRDTAQRDFGAAAMPALFLFSDLDTVVDPDASRGVASRWGGGAEVIEIEPAAGADPDMHVLAGDILSPGLTAMVRDAILDWVARQP
jgi:alpha-beta hydrolase superfamily lysophospholipase